MKKDRRLVEKLQYVKNITYPNKNSKIISFNVFSF